MPETDRFIGFVSGKSRQFIMPEEFFTLILPTIDDLDELKLLILLIQTLNLSESGPAHFSLEQLSNQPEFLNYFDGESGRVNAAMHKAVEDGMVLKFEADGSEPFYFVNTNKARALIAQLQQGSLKSVDIIAAGTFTEPRTIYQMYEENIGIITPMMAEILKADETEFPADWIADAIKIAVERNARNWKYVHAILDSWKKEGRNGKIGSDFEKTRQRSKGKWLGQDE